MFSCEKCLRERGACNRARHSKGRKETKVNRSMSKGEVDQPHNVSWVAEAFLISTAPPIRGKGLALDDSPDRKSER
jgi:hypothetical protein